MFMINRIVSNLFGSSTNAKVVCDLDDDDNSDDGISEGPLRNQLQGIEMKSYACFGKL